MRTGSALTVLRRKPSRETINRPCRSELSAGAIVHWPLEVEGSTRRAEWQMGILDYGGRIPRLGQFQLSTFNHTTPPATTYLPISTGQFAASMEAICSVLISTDDEDVDAAIDQAILESLDIRGASDLESR